MLQREVPAPLGKGRLPNPFVEGHYMFVAANLVRDLALPTWRIGFQDKG
jgi:hypothetical protein